MITKFTCSCGNTDPKKAKEYDGALGYETIVCTTCGRYYDFDLDGREQQNEPDDWSQQYVKK